MAVNDPPIKGGLATDPRAFPFYGAKDEDISEYQKSLDDSIKALQQRYAQPNWFNVAAGFFKPQLGGFAASLGSASEALGQNVERERESQLPIAQMRTQLAMSKAVMSRNKQGAEVLADWKKRGSPPGEMAALAQELESLGATDLASGVKSKLDTMRATTASDQQALQIFQTKRAADIAAVQTQLAGKLITKEQAATLLDEITKRQPPSVTSFSLLPEAGAAAKAAGDAKGPGVIEKAPVPAPAAADAAKAVTPPAPAAEAAATADAAAKAAAAKAVEPAASPKAKILIKPVISLNDERLDTDSKIRVREAQVLANQKEGNEIYGFLRDVAGPETYNDTITPIENSLKLLGYGETDPAKKAALEAKAKKVMNVLSGNTFNAFLKAVDTGVGGKVGDLYAQINLPIEQFVRAKFPPDLQDYAKDLAQNLAQAAIAKQKLGGINQSTARNAELHLWGQSAPTMDTTPLAAMKNLMHMHTSISQLKAMYDFIDQVDTGNHPEYAVDPDNDTTRYFDIARSKGYKSLADKYAEKHKAIEEARKK